MPLVQNARAAPSISCGKEKGLVGNIDTNAIVRLGTSYFTRRRGIEDNGFFL